MPITGIYLPGIFEKLTANDAVNVALWFAAIWITFQVNIALTADWEELVTFPSKRINFILTIH